jgi:hypothetical protein
MSVALVARSGTGRVRRTGLARAAALTGVAEASAAVGLAGMPLLVPAGPGNTGPADVLIILSCAGVGYAAVAGALRWRAPYLVPVLLFVVAGGLGGLLHHRPGPTSLAIAQDGLLLVWAGSLAAVARDERVMGRLLRLWARSAIAWSALLVVAVATGHDRLAGVTSNEGQRTAFTFGDPNRAGSYFALSFFVLLAAAPKLHGATVRLGAVSILLATAFTGSNAALLSVMAGISLGLLVMAVRRAGALAAIAGAAMVAAAVVTVLSFVQVSVLQEEARAGGRILANSVARSGQGGEDRRLLLTENFAVYQSGAGGLFGTGPGGTKTLLAERQSPYVKEAHNDWMAALIERGPLGLLALGLLAGAVALPAIAVCAATADTSFTRSSGSERLYWLAAAALSAGVYGWFHEALHFRQVWALLGLLAAAGWLTAGRDRPESEE